MVDNDRIDALEKKLEQWRNKDKRDSSNALKLGVSLACDGFALATLEKAITAFQELTTKVDIQIIVNAITPIVFVIISFIILYTRRR